jgi:mono/diheme cytochrome c family protein
VKIKVFIRRLSLVAALMFAMLVIVLILPPARTAGSGPIAVLEGVSEDELLARGEYLTTAGNCISCHTSADGEPMAGGLAFETPFGRVYSTNITPDSETGIGSWSEWDFLNSLRHGVRPNGEQLYPVFPYTAYTRLSDTDIAAMFAYLQSLPPVSNQVPDNQLSFPFNQRPLMKLWKMVFFDAGAFEPEPQQSEQWNRGAYLVEALAHCSACHTPRNSLGAEQSRLAFGGGEYLDRVSSGEFRPWSAPNLTSSERGLGLWSQSNLEAYLKTARNEFIESYGPMNEVILNSTRHLSADDIAAMATYLKQLPAIDEAPGLPVDAQVMGRGRTVYNLHCGTCHLPTGEGDPEMAPRLNAGSLVVQSDNPASMINTILYAPQLPEHGLPQRWREPMEEFQYLLDDEEVAAAATYIRNSWDNSAGLVTAEQVARQR